MFVVEVSVTVAITSVLMLLVFFTNGLLLTMLIREVKLRSLSIKVIFLQTLNDFLTGLIYLPIYLALILTTGSVSYYTWLAESKYLYQVWLVLKYLFSRTQSTVLCLVALDRVLILKLGPQYRSVMTNTKFFVTVSAALLVTLTVTAVRYVGYLVPSLPRYPIIVAIDLVIHVILVFCLVYSILLSRKMQRNMQQNCDLHSSVRKWGLCVVCFYLICFTPDAVLLSLLFFDRHLYHSVSVFVRQLLYQLMVVNSVFNAVLFMCLNMRCRKRFRNFYRALFTRGDKKVSCCSKSSDTVTSRM